MSVPVFALLPPGEAHASLTSLMTLFLLASIPFWLLLVVSFHGTLSKKWIAVFLPFIGGLLAGMAEITVTLGLLTRTPFSMDLPGIFRWAWLRGPGWPMLVTVFIIIFKCIRTPTTCSRILTIASGMSGTAFIYTFWYAVTPDPGFDFFRIFFMPFLWMGSISATALLVDRGLRIHSWVRFLLFGVATVFASGINFLSVFYFLGEVFYTLIIAVMITLTSTFLIFLDSRDRLG